MLALEHSVCSMPLADIRSNGMLLLQMKMNTGLCQEIIMDNKNCIVVKLNSFQ